MSTPRIPCPIPVGSRLRFAHDGKGKHWWTVRATHKRFVVLTAPALFKPKGTLMYTVLDFERHMRGPCDLLGNGYGDGSYSTAECEAMLAEFVAADLHVSRRNHVDLRITEFEPAPHPQEPTP